MAQDAQDVDLAGRYRARGRPTDTKHEGVSNNVEYTIGIRRGSQAQERAGVGPAVALRRRRGATPSQRRPGGWDSLEEVGALSERAAVGDGARGLQRVGRRVELL